MTEREKKNLIALISNYINSLPTDGDVIVPIEPKPDSEKPQLLTNKEALAEISGLSENTLRQLLAQGKLPHIRSGAGERGKILIYRNSLLKFFNK